MSLELIKRNEGVDLAAGPAEQLRAAVLATASESSALKDFVLFPLLSPELRAKIIEAYLDDFFVRRGRKVQFLSGKGGESLVHLPTTALISREWRAESLRRLVVTTIQGFSWYTGEKHLAPTAVDPAADMFFLRAGFRGAYPAWARVMLSKAQNVAIPASMILAKRDYHSGLIKKSLAPGGILSGLEKVHVVPSLDLRPIVIEIKLKQEEFLEFVTSRLGSFASTDKIVVGDFKNLYFRQVIPLARRTREIFVSLEDDEAWASLIDILSPAGAQMQGGNDPAPSFKDALEFKRFGALYEWEKTKRKLAKVAEKNGIKVGMVGTIKVTVCQQYWENFLNHYAPYGTLAMFEV